MKETTPKYPAKSRSGYRRIVSPANAHPVDTKKRHDVFVSHTPMGRIGNLGELIGAAIYPASPASDFATGQAVIVDGGFLAMGVWE